MSRSYSFFLVLVLVFFFFFLNIKKSQKVHFELFEKGQKIAPKARFFKWALISASLFDMVHLAW